MFSREGQTGRRFVTEATLIYSSLHSLKSSSSYDRLNVSRDVTFPQNLKRLLRALILSCLIVCWRSYDKQTRVVVGGERGLGGGAADGNVLQCSGPALPPDPDASANYLFVYFRGVRDLFEVGIKIRGFLQTSRIALNLINTRIARIRFIPKTNG